ncbi:MULTISPECIES: hypothetical protein [Acetobacter]|nr:MULTISPECIES: hypothetical protein [Acetobacter]KAA8426554.1 hypothetical protein FKW54_06925 [Acetobacter pomorum]KAA8436027.1 hypothetical protein FKW50_05785 [Acetobacter pomorum]KAA8454051.1 hypothetical protein FKW52_01845 [Acetobacter pomorum]
MRFRYAPTCCYIMLASFLGQASLAQASQHGYLLWQKAYTGMTEQKIKSLYPSVTVKENTPDQIGHTHLSDDNYMVGKCKTTLDFEFKDNALMSISISLKDLSDMNCQSELHGSVETKYGPPNKTRVINGGRSEVWNRKGGVTIEVMGGSFPSLNQYMITILYYKTGNDSMASQL